MGVLLLSYGVPIAVISPIRTVLTREKDLVQAVYANYSFNSPGRVQPEVSCQTKKVSGNVVEYVGNVSQVSRRRWGLPTSARQT